MLDGQKCFRPDDLLPPASGEELPPKIPGGRTAARPEGMVDGKQPCRA
ncbi:MULTISPECIES: hypothetical protein [Bradyrhizobium]|nr:hypothetical protein [Bradyrhizobium elkanii]